jgi:hypothetical protein
MSAPACADACPRLMQVMGDGPAAGKTRIDWATRVAPRCHVPFALRSLRSLGMLAAATELAAGAPALGDSAVESGVAGAGDLSVEAAEALS